MALNTQKLENDIFKALKTAFNFSDLPAGEEKKGAKKSYEKLAEDLSTAIEVFVKSGTVNTRTDKKVAVTVTGGSGNPATSVKEKVDSTGDIT